MNKNEGYTMLTMYHRHNITVLNIIWVYFD